MTKRNDLQGIRGIAIIVVLMFHLNPPLFPFGFIGVDMFFVLSGFLLTMILSQKKSSIDTLLEFYGKRFKRIVPLFIFILTMVYAVSNYILLSTDRLQFLLDLKWSLAFVSNLQPLYEVLGYWDQVNAYRFLVHCWSLGVEIQFYLIAPFIIGYMRTKKYNLLVTMLLLFSSLIFQLNSTTKMAYGFPFSRIWQFLCGTIAFEVISRNEWSLVSTEINGIEYESLNNYGNQRSFVNKHSIIIPVLRDISITLIVLAVIWNPSFLNETSTRILGTILTTLIIVISQPSNSSLICSKWLVFIGNISYTLYLVHWPVIVFIKYYYNITELGYYGTILSLALMSTISILIHYLVEQPLIKADYIVGWSVIIISILFILLTLPYYLRGDPVPEGVISEAIKFNEQENSKVYFKLPCTNDFDAENWTLFTEEPPLRCQTTGNGTKTCPPLSNYCPMFTKASHTVVEKMRPDVIFIIQIATEGNFTAPVTDWKTDQMYREYQENLNFYSNFTSKIIIDLPYFVYQKERPAKEIVRRLKLGLSLSDIQVTKEEASVQQHWHRLRINRLNCSKCIMNDLDEVLFATNGVHYLYNRKNLFAYTSDGGHFTPEGLEILKPNYKKIIEGIFN